MFSSMSYKNKKNIVSMEDEKSNGVRNLIVTSVENEMVDDVCFLLIEYK